MPSHNCCSGHAMALCGEHNAANRELCQLYISGGHRLLASLFCQISGVLLSSDGNGSNLHHHLPAAQVVLSESECPLAPAAAAALVCEFRDSVLHLSTDTTHPRPHSDSCWRRGPVTPNF